MKENRHKNENNFLKNFSTVVKLPYGYWEFGKHELK